MKKYALLLLFFVSGINYSQKPNLGIGIGLSFLNSNEYNFVSPIHFSLNLRQKIVDKTNIKFDIGFAFYAEEYGGLDLNLLLENEIYKKMKIIGGINSHHNGGIAHGTAFSTETYSKTFYNYIK